MSEEELSCAAAVRRLCGGGGACGRKGKCKGGVLVLPGFLVASKRMNVLNVVTS